MDGVNTNQVNPAQNTPPPEPPPPPREVGNLKQDEGVVVEVKPDDTQEQVLNRAYEAMAERADLSASGRAAFVAKSDREDNYSNHLMRSGQQMSDADFEKLKSVGHVQVLPATGHMQSLATIAQEDAPKVQDVQATQPKKDDGGILGGFVDGVKNAYDSTVDAKNWLGEKIEGGVKSAEQGIDGFRKDMVSFGRDHGGIIGESVAKTLSDNIGFVEGGALAVYDMGSGIVKLADNASSLTNPLEWAFHADRNISRIETTGKVADKLGSLASPVDWVMNPQKNIDTAGALWNGVTKGYQDAAKDGDAAKFAGRFVVDVGSFFIGAGEVNAAMKGAEGANAVVHTVEAVTDVARGTEVASDLAKGGEVAAATADTAKAADAGNAVKGADAAKAADATDAAKSADAADAAKTGDAGNEAKAAKEAKPTTLSELPKNIDPARISRGTDGLISHIDGKPFKEFMNELVNARANEYRALRQNKAPGYTNAETGPVVSIAVDRKTGAIFEGTNTQIADTASLDKLLQKQLGDLKGTAHDHGPYDYAGKGTGDFPHPSEPGTHAEVSAVDQAIKARRANGENVTWADLKRDLYYDNAFLDKSANRAAPTCANCTPILDGIPTDVGHFNQFPPKP